MKKQMKNVTRTIWALRNVLAVFCVAAVLYGVSFVCHADTVKGTITGTSVNVRETASTTATALESLTTNDLVDVIAETTGDDGMKWYKITTESGVTGYVRSDLIKKATVTVDVTQTESKTAYIAGSNANIRQDASTSSGRVANARGGSQVTIIGEATGADGYKWYQIEFVGNGTTMTGFIRSDLVTFQAPTQDPEVTEIEGEMGEEEPESTSEPVDTSEPAPEDSSSEPANTDIPADGDSKDLTIMEPVSALEVIPEGFEQTQLQLGEDTFTVWGKGQFYIIYASVNGEQPQYYFYDSIHKSFVAYEGLFTESDVAVPEEKEGLNYKLITVICIVVIAILLMVIGILAYKLSHAGYQYDDDDDDDDYYEDDDDEDEDDYVDLSDDIYVEDSVAAPVEDSLEYEDATIQMPVESINMVQPEYDSETQTVQETEYMPEETVQEVEYVPVETAQEEIYISQTEDTDNDGILYEEDAADDYEEEEDEQPQPKKAKLSKRLLDFFTVEVEEDEDDDDDEVEEEPKKRKKAKKTQKVQESLFDDDDDDDLNFIDL